MRLVSISDLHFYSATYSPMQLFSKRITTNLNYLLNRKKKFDPQQTEHYLTIIRKIRPDYVLITGDLTCSAMSEELSQAKNFHKELSKITPNILLIPGNHDSLTLFSRGRYYKTFNDQDLKNKRLKCIPLNSNWDLLLIDTCYFFPHFLANGYFSQQLEQKLASKLDSIHNKSVILACHFPLEAYGYPQKHLIRFEALKTLLKSYPQVKLYISGHKHKSSIISTTPYTQVQNPALFDRSKGGFYTINLNNQDFSIEQYLRK